MDGTYEEYTPDPSQKPPVSRDHHWSGWPGAWCLDCGLEDPMEHALATNLYDPYTDTWEDTEQARTFREEAVANKYCPCPGSDNYNPYKKKEKTMGHHINDLGQFQSDKHPDLKPDHIVLDFNDPSAKGPLALYASISDDDELNEDILARLKSLSDAEAGG